MKSLYFSFIQHYLDYNFRNWSVTNKTNLECIRISLKKAVRIISFKQRLEHSAPPFQNLEILPLDQHIICRKSSFMWKVARNLLPHTLAYNFTLNDSQTSCIAQRLIQGNYHLPAPRLDYTKRHVTFPGLQLWNSNIPNDLKSLTTFKLFCKKCKSWLLDTLH